MSVEIRPHHQRVIDRLIDLFRDDPAFPAMIVGGSVTKGIATDKSDVDIMLIATDEEFARRKALGELWYFNTEVCDYEGGYVDGKIMDRAFLAEAADHGSEPTRSSFSRIIIGYNRDADLGDLIARIPVYQEAEREDKMLAFYGQVMLWGGYFSQEAEKRADPYLRAQAAASLVLYAGRIVLAHNRILFPCQKRLMETLRRAPDQPDNFLDLATAALEHPSAETARALRTSIEAFMPNVDYGKAVSRYMSDSEWRWRKERPDLADW